MDDVPENGRSMRYREHRVPPPLDACVECVWLLNVTPGEGAEPVQQILPDGCIEIVFHFADRFSAVSSGRLRTPQPASFIVGMLTSPFVVAPAARADTMGVRFRPGGAYPFVSCPLTLLKDRALSPDELWGPGSRGLWEQLAEAPTDAARVDLISRALLERLVRARLDRVIDSATSDLVKTAGRASITRIAAGAGVTPRHLQRRFGDLVGVAPKMLARILRFQNTLRHRGAGAKTVDWAHVASACGFADQSHLIRDYAAFAGETPVSLLAAEGELSAYFTAPQRLDALFADRL